MSRAGLIMLIVAGEALAHPDHGSGGWLSAALSHLLSEPDHLAMILAPLVVVAWIAWRLVRRSDKRPSGPVPLRATRALPPRNAVAPSGSADESGSRRAD
jgi:hypothetical protein